MAEFRFRVGGAWPPVRAGHTLPINRRNAPYARFILASNYQKSAAHVSDAEQQEHDHHGGQREPVVGEDEQAVPGKVIEKKPCSQIPDDPRGDAADHEEQPSRESIPDPKASTRLKSAAAVVMGTLMETRRLVPPEPQKEADQSSPPSGRRGTGPPSGPGRYQRLLEAQLVGGTGLPAHALTHDEERANQHQVERDEPRRAPSSRSSG